MFETAFQVFLAYLTFGFLVYIIRFTFTDYVSGLIETIDDELSDLRKRQIKKTLGETGVFALIIFYDVCFHLFKWPVILWDEIKLKYYDYKIKKIEEGISKMNNGLEMISRGKSEEGERLLEEGKELIEYYGEREQVKDNNT